MIGRTNDYTTWVGFNSKGKAYHHSILSFVWDQGEEIRKAEARSGV